MKASGIRVRKRKPNGMMKNVFVSCCHFLGLLLLGCSFWPSATAQPHQAPRNFLYKEYQSKKATPDLFKVAAWRQAKKESIVEKIAQLPDSVKQILTQRADQMLEKEWPMLTLSTYLVYTRTGNRTQYESQYFGRRNKLTLLVIGELVSRQGKYLPEIADGLWMMLEETSWAVPSTLHMLQQAGEGLPDHNEPVIDLFAGETATLIAWTKLFLEKELAQVSPLLVSRMQDELQHRIITPYIERDDFWWMGFQGRRPNNWNVFCNKNTLITTLLVEDDPVRQEKVLDKSMRSIDLFINHYPADGGCDEGPGYWSMAGGGLGDYVEILTSLTNHQLDFSDNELIHNIGSYIYKMHIADRRFVNFADATPFISPDPSKVYHFGALFDDELLKQFASYCYQISDIWRKGFTGRETMNSFMANVEVETSLRAIARKAPLLAESWLLDLQVLSLRSEAGNPKSFFLGAKGGHNGESHNHNDVGNFVLYLDEQPFLIDLGPATYRKETFSSERWKIWNFQSEWHNCPTINGVQQKNGRKFAAKGTSYRTQKKQQILSMDLADCYPPEAEVQRWQRELIFDPGKETLTLRENFQLKEWKVPFQVNFLTAQRPELLPNGDVRLKAASTNQSILFRFDPKLFELVIEEKVLDDNLLARNWGQAVYRLALKSKSRALGGKHEFVFRVAET